jgi:hypothetical protein
MTTSLEVTYAHRYCNSYKELESYFRILKSKRGANFRIGAGEDLATVDLMDKLGY